MPRTAANSAVTPIPNPSPIKGEGGRAEMVEWKTSQAFSTKLSMTFFSPALSKATVSLLPSMPFTWP